jgi:hypothetical protein
VLIHRSVQCHTINHVAAIPLLIPANCDGVDLLPHLKGGDDEENEEELQVTTSEGQVAPIIQEMSKTDGVSEPQIISATQAEPNGLGDSAGKAAPGPIATDGGLRLDDLLAGIVRNVSDQIGDAMEKLPPNRGSETQETD